MNNAPPPTPALPCPGLAVAPWDASATAVHELLESLDDAMFAAIGGDPAALARARALWDAAVRELPREVVDESREQYLRRAAEAARQAGGNERDPAQAVAAIEVLGFLGPA